MGTTAADKRQNFYSQIMIILLGLITIRLWVLPISLLPDAQAQVPDSGAQRQKLIQEAEKTNAKLDLIYKHLNEKTINVIIQGEKEANVKKPSVPRKPSE